MQINYSCVLADFLGTKSINLANVRLNNTK